MTPTSDHPQPIAARLRLLGAPAAALDGSKLIIASSLARDLTAAASSAAASQPRPGDPPLPVLAHYCRTLLEWTASSILKLKPSPPPPSTKPPPTKPAPTMATSPTPQTQTLPTKPPNPSVDPATTFLASALAIWQLLQFLLEGNSSPSSDNANGPLPAVATTATTMGGNPPPACATGSGARTAPSPSPSHVPVPVAALTGSTLPGSLLPAASQCLKLVLATATGSTGFTSSTATAPTATGNVLSSSNGAAPVCDGTVDDTTTAATATALCHAIRLCLYRLLPAAAGGGGGASYGGNNAGGGGGASSTCTLRPTLEQCLTLLTAVLDLRPRAAQSAPDSRSSSSQTATATKLAAPAPEGPIGPSSAGKESKKRDRQNARKSASEPATHTDLTSSAPPTPAPSRPPPTAALTSTSASPQLPTANHLTEWCRLCAIALQATHSAVQGHPAPKKVWQAFVPSLLLPLLEAVVPGEPLGATCGLVLGGGGGFGGFGGGRGLQRQHQNQDERQDQGLGGRGGRKGAGGSGGGGPGVGLAAVVAAVVAGGCSGGDRVCLQRAVGELSRGAQQLLGAVLFHEAHVGPLAELFYSLTAPTRTDASAGGPAAPSTATQAAPTAPTAQSTEGPKAAPSTAQDAAPLAHGATGAAGGDGMVLLPGFGELVSRSYHGQLLQTLALAMASKTPATAPTPTSGVGPDTPSHHSDALITGLPWLLQGFCRAASRLRRVQAADAAAAAGAGGGTGTGGGGTSRKHQQHHTTGEDEGPAGGQEGAAAGVGAASQKALAAAEFNCMVTLSYMLLRPPLSVKPSGGGEAGGGGQPVKKKRKLGGAAVEAGKVAEVEAAAGGVAWRRLALAGLLAAGRAAGAYQPTRDLTGAHAAALATITQQLLTTAPPPSSPPPLTPPPHAAASRSGGEGGQDGGLGPLSTSLALAAVLDLDHRVLTPHLERMWSLLCHTVATSTTSTTSAGGMAAAAAVLHRTIRAFSELRQLQSLLSSLGAAMRALYVQGGGVSRHEGGAKELGGKACVFAALLVRPEVLGALRRAVWGAPSGQLPSLVGWVTSEVTAWAGIALHPPHPHHDGNPGVVTQGAASHSEATDAGDGKDRVNSMGTARTADLLLAAGALYDTVLAALRIDLAGAVTVGQANQRLLAVVSEPLVSAVRLYCKARATVGAAGEGREGYDGGAAAKGASLRVRTAWLAALLRVYGAIVHTNAVCSGLHPEVAPLLDQEIYPRDSCEYVPKAPAGGVAAAAAAAGAGYFAASLVLAASSSTAAAAAAATTATGVDGGGDDKGNYDVAAGATTDLLRKLRKALKRVGASGVRKGGPLGALAQVGLLPGLVPVRVQAMGRRTAAAAGEGGEGGPAGSLPAADWADVELSRAVHRCLCHRAQTLHERLLRRRHDCPMYRTHATAGTTAATGAMPAEATAGGQGGVDPSDANAAGDATEKDKEAAEEQELRLVAHLILAPFSAAAAEKGGAVAMLGVAAASGAYAEHATGRRLAIVAMVAAAAMAATAAVWGDTFSLMSCIAPWVDKEALTEVLHLAMSAFVQVEVSLSAAMTMTTSRRGGSGGSGALRLMRLLQPPPAAGLRLLEFQALPGVRHALPHAWSTVFIAALQELTTAVRQLAAGLSGSEGDDEPQLQRGRSAKKKARKSKAADDGGTNTVEAVSVAGSTGAGTEQTDGPVGSTTARLDALLAAVAAAAAASRPYDGDGEEDGDGDRNGVCDVAHDGSTRQSADKALRTVLSAQLTGIEKAAETQATMTRYEAGPSMSHLDLEAAAATTTTVSTSSDLTAAAIKLRIVLSVLYGNMHLELLSLAARQALGQQLTAAAGILMELLLGLLQLSAQQQPLPSKMQMHEQQPYPHPHHLTAQQLLSGRQELVTAATSCLQAWQRLAMTTCGSPTPHTYEKHDPADDMSSEDEEEEKATHEKGTAVRAVAAAAKAKRGPTTRRAATGTDEVAWFLGASRLLVSEAAVLDYHLALASRCNTNSNNPGNIDGHCKSTAAPAAVSVELVYVAGRLMEPLLARRGCTVTAPAAGKEAVSSSSLPLGPHLALTTQLLDAAASHGTPTTTSSTSSTTSTSLQRYQYASSNAAASVLSARVALDCRFALAAATVAAAAVGVTSQGLNRAPGGKSSGRGSSVMGGSGSGEVGRALVARLSTQVDEMLRATTATAAAERSVSFTSLGTAADDAAAAAAASGLAMERRLSAVHVLRAALCVAGIKGLTLQLTSARGASVGDVNGDGGEGVRKNVSAQCSTGPDATAVGAGGRLVAGRGPAAAAAAAARQPLEVLSDVIRRASEWTAAEWWWWCGEGGGEERRRSAGGIGGGGGCDQAGLTTEPLEHCVGLLYGIGAVMPYIQSSGGRREGTAAGGGSGGDAAKGAEAVVEVLQGQLIAVQQALMMYTSPPQRACFSRTSNMWGVLLADLDPKGARCRSRQVLLQCFRDLLTRSSLGRYGTILRRLTAPLTSLDRPSLTLQPGQSPAVALPHLQCLLVALESLTDPRVAVLLTALGPALAAALTDVMTGMAARAHVAAAAGRECADDVASDAVWFGGGGANGVVGNGGCGGEVSGQGAAVEALLCCAVRCLQSMLGREVTFPLSPAAVAGALSAAVVLASCPIMRPQPLLGAGPGQVGAANRGGGVGFAVAAAASERYGDGDAHYLYVTLCGLVVAAVRHHETAVRHCAALVVEGARGLLLCLARWAGELRHAQRQMQLLQQLQQSHGSNGLGAAAERMAAAVEGMTRCAGALARVYEAVSEHPKTLGKYGIHLLADYIVHVATPMPSLALLMHDDGSGGGTTDPWVSAAVAAHNSHASSSSRMPAAPALEAAIHDHDTNLTNGDDSDGDGHGDDDAIVHALLYGSTTAGDGGGGIVPGMGLTTATLLPPAAHQALRQGAFSLMGCLNPQQLQHLHMVLGVTGGAGGGGQDGGQGAARRSALAQLRKEYDSSYRYTGKV